MNDQFAQIGLKFIGLVIVLFVNGLYEIITVMSMAAFSMKSSFITIVKFLNIIGLYI